MEEQLYRKFVMISCIFVLFSFMTVALFVFGQIGMEHVSAFATENATRRAQEAEAAARQRENEQAKAADSSLMISLPKDVKVEDVTVENIYMDQTIKVTIAGKWNSFFEQKKPRGSQKYVDAVYYQATDDSTQVYIAMSELCEQQVHFTENEMQFTLTPIREMYDKIVVIDAGYGGEEKGNSAYGMDEKDITLDVAHKLTELFEQTDIKAYCTRTDDVNPTLEKRANLANALKADLFISIHVNADESTRTTTGITSCYNQVDTQSQLTNQELAQLLQKKVILQTSAADRGVVQLQEENELLRQIEVPAAVIEIGYVTNKQEAIKMASEAYKDRVAKGIYEAVFAALRVTEDEQ